MSAGEMPNPDDPFDHYLDYRERIGRDPSTIHNDRRAIELFEEYLEEQGIQPADVVPEVCTRFLDWLEYEEGYAERTTREHGAKIDGFYRYYNSRGYYEANPMEIALESDTRKRKKKKRVPEVSIADMRDIVHNIKHPLNLIIIFLLVKTGIRRAEVYNIDLRDINLDDSRVDDILPEPRAEIQRQADSLYIPN